MGFEGDTGLPSRVWLWIAHITKIEYEAVSVPRLFSMQVWDPSYNVGNLNAFSVHISIQFAAAAIKFNEI